MFSVVVVEQNYCFFYNQTIKSKVCLLIKSKSMFFSCGGTTQLFFLAIKQLKAKCVIKQCDMQCVTIKFQFLK